jgi:hypothetical protein
LVNRCGDIRGSRVSQPDDEKAYGLLHGRALAASGRICRSLTLDDPQELLGFNELKPLCLNQSTKQFSETRP